MSEITTHGKRALSFEAHPNRANTAIVRLDHHYDLVTREQVECILRELQVVLAVIDKQARWTDWHGEMAQKTSGPEEREDGEEAPEGEGRSHE